MLPVLRLIALCSLLACTAGADKDDETSGSDETEQSDETDTDRDSDSDSDSDTAPVNPDFIVTVDDLSDFSGATLGMFPLDDALFAVTSEIPSTTVEMDPSGSFSWAYTPTSAELVEAPWASGLKVASYALVIYEGEPDADGLRAAVRFDAMYMEGTIPQQYQDVGFVEGWNAVWTSDEEAPVITDRLALEVDANLLPSLSATAGGTWTGAEGKRVGGWSITDPDLVVSAAPASTPWSVTASGDPPASSIFDSGEVRVAGFRLCSWEDSDSNGSWSATDEWTDVGVTAAGDPAWISWGGEVSTASQAHILVTKGGFRVGWSVVYGTEGSKPVDPAEVDSLLMTPGQP
jgi:hypothetical protein